jgi:hypothetical protein
VRIWIFRLAFEGDAMMTAIRHMQQRWTWGVLLIAFLLITGTLAAQTTISQIDNEFVFDARADLEVLADSVFSEGVRPQEWAGNFDINSASLIPDLWYDNELAADIVFGAAVRPPNWLGVTTSSAESLARNVRHDLEIMADEVFGLDTRPDTWRGAPVLLTCDRTLQNTLQMLTTFYRVERITPESAINYCNALESEIEDPLVNIVFGTPRSDGTIPDLLALLGSVRGDLERTADELLGLNTRPPGYIGNRDPNTPTFVGDLLLDLNALADQELGAGVRPPEWIGQISNNPAVSYLNLRHDVELLTDATLGVSVRPNGWQGTDPLTRCRPQISLLAVLVQENYGIGVGELDPAALDFCAQVEESLNSIVENPPILDVVLEEQRFTSSSNFAFSFLDVAASQYMGVMPGGTLFRAVYRNFGESNMMFVVGQDFALYVDRRFTNIEETLYNSLPTLENANPVTFCDAGWCNGPAPVPTATGSTPLEQVVFSTTPQATPDPSTLETTKQLVSWNFIRVTYVQDNLSARTAQVTLEVCAQPAAVATACEPAIRVFDTATGTEKPILGQSNGLNVYEFRYGYTTNILIESATRYSTDVWISDPTIR